MVGVRLVPGLRPAVADDPDELVRLVDGPGAEHGEAVLLAQRDDPLAPFVQPIGHLTRLDGVLADLPGHACVSLRGAPDAARHGYGFLRSSVYRKYSRLLASTPGSTERAPLLIAANVMCRTGCFASGAHQPISGLARPLTSTDIALNA